MNFSVNNVPFRRLRTLQFWISLRNSSCVNLQSEGTFNLGPWNKVEHEMGLIFIYAISVAILRRLYTNNTKPVPVIFYYDFMTVINKL
jgi:hypothetical protein